MISRRQLRIKTLQTLYAYYTSGQENIEKAEKELIYNIDKAYDLYHYLLMLIIEVADYAEGRIDLARNKLKPTFEDLHPNTRFIDNRLVGLLRDCDQLKRYRDHKKLSWVNYPELIREIYLAILEDAEYKEYMERETVTFSDDKKIIAHICTHIILPDLNLDQALEEQSIYWNDDLEFMISMVLKTIKKLKEDTNAGFSLPPLFKNEEDRDFAVQLFRESIIHRTEYLEYIKKNTNNWDLERIAFMDILIMQMAITEFIGFQSIPTKVTLNEYLDISKSYSTSKSSVFINGVLDKVVADLKSEKKIQKTGRGLIGENIEEV